MLPTYERQPLPDREHAPIWILGEYRPPLIIIRDRLEEVHTRPLQRYMSSFYEGLSNGPDSSVADAQFDPQHLSDIYQQIVGLPAGTPLGYGADHDGHLTCSAADFRRLFGDQSKFTITHSARALLFQENGVRMIKKITDPVQTIDNFLAEIAQTLPDKRLTKIVMVGEALEAQVILPWQDLLAGQPEPPEVIDFFREKLSIFDGYPLNLNFGN
ncbi:hypothetical protein A2966_04935 [Candidatus Roizmanbacteria bacterium RIFCSPLOWO2_01_FULL_41_22]|uniref:Uncharacterized protein n=1 Tax=Candidatus Roizmanbacteria bacterium RIFCSPLOWO2_01_FULL_41_22 TaxID=1802067 RepID=A0A1F7J7R8_9BACT|nr:MAG: hypothetical protein A2966_04935 [Candidatus Roizmanbacteria bacterium RIFCSPLOWO2_01_FULL_41_22]